MTAAPPEPPLEAAYARSAASARRLVASRYPLSRCEPGSPDYPASKEWREVWRICATTPAGLPLVLLVAVPSLFPDVLPAAYVSVESAEQHGSVPHLDRHRFLCTLDSEEAVPNADQPGQVALAVIERALTLWDDGVSGANACDFADEFSAYWEQAETINALSLVEPDDVSRRVYVSRLRKPWKGYGIIFAGTLQAAQNWLNAVGYTGRIFTREALYLPLAGLGRPPFPETNRDLYARLVSEAPEALPNLLTFLTADPRPSAVLCSVPVGDGRALQGWIHPAVLRSVPSRRGYIQVPGPVDGFRPGTCPPVHELLRANGGGRLTRLSVKRIDRPYLIERSAGETPAQIAQPVTVIGCGSLGSMLSANLAQSGMVRRFRLVDPQVLTPENTLRHYCGMDRIGEHKTTALAGELRRHYPHLRCDTVEDDVLAALRKESRFLAGSAITLIALGRLPVERRLNRFAHEDPALLSGPLCFLWVEPHLYGGHALYLGNPSGPGCYECLLDGTMRFSERVLLEPERFGRREAGCQTTYTPYSGSDMAAFVATAERFLTEHITAGTRENLLYSWAGDVGRARVQGIAVSGSYTAAFTGQERPVAPRTDCPICRLP